MLKKPKRVKLPKYLIAYKLYNGCNFCLFGFLLNKAGVPKKAIEHMTNLGYDKYNKDTKYKDNIYNPEKIICKIYNISKNQMISLMQKNDETTEKDRIELLKNFLNNRGIKYYL